MCGRYHIDEDLEGRVKKDFEGILIRPDAEIPGGDVFPSEKAPVIAASGEDLALDGRRWGYPGMKKGSLIINARAESVRERKIFRGGIEHGRIAVPADSFYEWNPEREKYVFQRTDSSLLYLAGIMDFFGGEPRFVILTTQANDSVNSVHDRMPLILEKGQIADWVRDSRAADDVLRQKPVLLDRSAEYEQMSLF